MDLTPRFRIEHAMKIRGGNIMQTITLNNGVTMPQLGFGVYQIPLEEQKLFTKQSKLGID